MFKLFSTMLRRERHKVKLCLIVDSGIIDIIDLLNLILSPAYRRNCRVSACANIKQQIIARNSFKTVIGSCSFVSLIGHD